MFMGTAPRMFMGTARTAPRMFMGTARTAPRMFKLSTQVRQLHSDRVSRGRCVVPWQVRGTMAGVWCHGRCVVPWQVCGTMAGVCHRPWHGLEGVTCIYVVGVWYHGVCVVTCIYVVAKVYAKLS